MSYKHDADAWITKGTAKVLVDLLNGEHRSAIAHLTLERMIEIAKNGKQNT